MPWKLLEQNVARTHPLIFKVAPSKVTGEPHSSANEDKIPHIPPEEGDHFLDEETEAQGKTVTSTARKQGQP